MDLTLTLRPDNRVVVGCNGRFSHEFMLVDAIPGNSANGETPNPIQDPAAFGRVLFQVLFPGKSLARETLKTNPERVLLIAEDDELDLIPWEYAHNGEDFLVLELPFVRGLPEDKRIPMPDLKDTPLYIVAIPSNPLDEKFAPLNIEGEWQRLREIVEKLERQVTLERANPPTLDSLRERVANRQGRVVHFMGHGRRQGEKTVLFFEKENGAPDAVTARDLALTVRGPVFMATLNACSSATPGETEFGNLAAALVKRQIPYALGMRFVIPDDDALNFARAFYGDLAAGSPVETALFQARRSMARKSIHPWIAGVPVLYTSLGKAAPGFSPKAGTPDIREGQPNLDTAAIPRVEGVFRGRIPELLALGEALTGDRREKLLTIHGGGGLGKTALAREAVERYAHAWPGGVWAISLENLPTRPEFAARLAAFLGIPTDDLPEPEALERRAINILNQRRVLIVLDNTETLVEAVEQKNEPALELTALLREQISSTLAGLLVTSRYRLGFTGEKALELGGLSEEEGAQLFRQCAPICREEIKIEQARSLSRRVEGHPLALRLLGLAFDSVQLGLPEFIDQFETHLVGVRDKYKKENHRHHSLFASIETSVQFLDRELRDTLSALWIFHSPFMPDSAAEILASIPPGRPPSSEEEIEKTIQQIKDQLNTLHRRGLLAGERRAFRDGVLLTYRLLPTMRPYVRKMEQVYPEDDLMASFGFVYARLVRSVHQEMNGGGGLAWLAAQAREDFERGMDHVSGETLGWYLNHWGWVVGRLGDRKKALSLMGAALYMAQGQYQDLELHTINNMAGVYYNTGQPGKALEFYKHALHIRREEGNRRGEAMILNNMAGVYSAIGQPGKALELYQQALPIRREVRDRGGEAATLNNMALVYSAIGQRETALALYEQALPITREVGDRGGEAVTLNNMADMYRATGQPSKALALYEQALPIRREVGDRGGEATTLNNMGEVYRATGKQETALALYEQVLPIMREVGNRGGEATVLNNMASVYRDTGQMETSLALYEQALPIMREVGDRRGEAATLNNIALVYHASGQPGKAMTLYQQALPIRKEVRDREGEAATLTNIATVYSDTGQPGKALELYQQALPIRREVGDRAGEAATLNNMASVYRATGQPEMALALFEQVLPIRREVGDRGGEAATLNNMASVYSDTGQPETALALYGQALPITREVGDRKGEATTLNNMGEVYRSTGQPDKALALYEQVLPIKRKVGDRSGEAATLNNMALVYHAAGQPETALALYEQALPITWEAGDRWGEAVTSFNMAMLLRDGGKDEQALEFLNRAVLIEKQVQHPYFEQHEALFERWEKAMDMGEPLRTVK